MPKITTDIDRKTAGRLLGVSERTIDRYIRYGRLSAREEHRRIWLNKDEIMRFAHSEPLFFRRPVTKRQIMHTVSNKTKINETKFYQDLYEETKRALHEHQQKLEQSTYRIGQLESQLLHTTRTQIEPLPMPRVREEFRYERERENERERDVQILKDLLKRERASRIIFAILTYVLLIMLPIVWWLLR